MYSNRSGRTIARYVKAKTVAVLYSKNHTHYPLNNMSSSTIDFLIYKNINNISTPHTISQLSFITYPSSSYCERIIRSKYLPLNSTSSSSFIDWFKFRKHINSLLFVHYKIYIEADLKNVIINFTKIIKQSFTHATTHKNSHYHSSKLPQTAIDLISERNRSRKLWQRTRNVRYRLIFN